MHPPSFKQLLTTCIVLTVCLFLYSRRLWAVPTSHTHDEWAKPPPAPIQQDQSDPTIPTPPDAEKVEHQTPFQQIPYHWNDYQPLQGFFHGIRTLVDYKRWVPEQLQESADVKVADKIPLQPTVANPYAHLDGVQTCFLDNEGTVPAPDTISYPGIPANMPAPYFGGYEELGLAPNQCFERFGRLGAYGYSYSKADGGFELESVPSGEAALEQMIPKINYSKIKWDQVQKRCLEKNRERFGLDKDAVNKPDGALSRLWSQAEKIAGKKTVARNALVLRAWTGIDWSPMRIITTRSLINELSLKTGGQYDIHILLHITDDSINISNPETARKMIEENIPEEFWDITTPWSVPAMAEYYPGFTEDMTIENDSGKPLYSVYRIPHFALQWFAQHHPEYEFYWNWELDLRYTGNYFEFFDAAAKWSDKQPRKYLWERNERYWIPGLHGSWEDFVKHVEEETKASNFPSPWGPIFNDGVVDTSTFPPHPMDKDNYEWGVGEPADLITLNPLFDPEKNAWCLRYDITGYNQSVPPRRTSIITIGRFSRRLLQAMHEEASRNKHTMFPEMFPGSITLHHGLKGVYIPHPVYFDRRWPLDRLDSVFNKAETPESSVYYFPFTPGTGEANFLTASYYYNTEFGPPLWHRWLGRDSSGAGSPEAEKESGRMCLRGALIHPVKQDLAEDKAIGAT
ncbi:hypothetical protein SLS63_004622 [Diaporthe eres]|uniref:Major facilitator superfamily transporter n=1 Tax=Diaporthe eres TaxID=83184 RepID=A0ABR1PDV6_DIAER